MLASLSKRVRELDFEMEFTDEAVAEIGKAGFDPVYGARPLRRAIQSRIEDPLAEKLLEGVFRAGDAVTVTAENGQMVFGTNQP